MRKIFVVLFFILLTAFPAFAGVDDSGLQIYTLTGDKLLTMPPENVITGDSPYSPLSINCYNPGNGLKKYTGGHRLFTTPKNNAGVPELFLYPKGIAHVSDRRYFLAGGWDVTNGTWEVGLYTAPLYDNTTDITPAAGFTSYKSLVGTAEAEFSAQLLFMPHLFKAFPYINTTLKHALMIYGHSNMYEIDTNAGTVTINPFPIVGAASMTISSAAVFKNRLFISSTVGYIAYSQAAVFHNFTASDTEGGIFRIPSTTLSGYFNDMVATKDALYIFRGDGIWILTGEADPVTWTVEKLSDDKAASYGSGVVVAPNSAVYFVTTSGDLKRIEGTIVTRLGAVPDLPYGDFFISQSATIGDRYVAFTRERASGSLYNLFPTHAIIYDTLSNSFFYLTNITALSGDGYIASAKNFNYQSVTFGVNTVGFDMYDASQATTTAKNDTEAYSRPEVRADIPAQYDSNWLTCDGSESTAKIFKRIEFDYVFDTYETFLERNGTDEIIANSYYTYLTRFVPFGKATITPYVTFKAIYSKNSTDTVSETLTTVNSLNPQNGAYNYRTFALNLNAAYYKGATNSIRFQITTNGGNFQLKQVRIYYVPVGSYKSKGNGIN